MAAQSNTFSVRGKSSKKKNKSFFPSSWRVAALLLRAPLPNNTVSPLFHREKRAIYNERTILHWHALRMSSSRIVGWMVKVCGWKALLVQDIYLCLITKCCLVFFIWYFLCIMTFLKILKCAIFWKIMMLIIKDFWWKKKFLGLISVIRQWKAKPLTINIMERALIEETHKEGDFQDKLIP